MKNIFVKYIGVDINKNFIEKNKERYKDDNNATFYVIKTIKDIKENFDWFFASGSLTYTFTLNEIIELLQKIFKTVEDTSVMESIPKEEGRSIAMLLGPKQNNK